MHQLHLMFGHLEASQRRAYVPKPWCHAFKDEDGKPVNVFRQQDAQVSASRSGGRAEPGRGLVGRLTANMQPRNCRRCPDRPSSARPTSHLARHDPA